MKATFQDQTLYHGDFHWSWQEVKDLSVHLILTDPPYGAITQAQNWDRRPNFHHLAWIFRTLLIPTGQVASFCDFRTGVNIENGFQENFDFRFKWTWQKPSAPPRNSHRPAGDTEDVLVYKLKGTRVKEVTFNKVEIETEGQPFRRPGGKTQNLNPTLNRGGNLPDEYVNETGRRFPRSVLYFANKPCMVKKERTAHPTQKPVALLEYILKALTNPGDLILDPFAGSASTLVACHRLGRRGIGFEINQEYFEMGCDRLAREIEGVAQP